LDDWIIPMATIYVTADGDDETGDGSCERPFRTIEKAISIANEGDTILIDAGLFEQEPSAQIEGLSFRRI
jgi:hypothetical protein